ncbi:hypothetical protein [Paenibacillus sp. HB172176]|uniref:GH39 family glycosyl hydrolase n=1 Tax=Paenibacillus sp. HB172176 TaxID=2493690 RepID=UPI00143C00A3|nr:hypothetical protein [Paenibacillus sp. HB172176]
MNYKSLVGLPVSPIHVNLNKPVGAFEWWRHTISHGGINNLPLPEAVASGARRLKPRLLRTFIQEYFNIYPEHGVYDWSKLDPYMESLHSTGADVVASICFKPPLLFPVIDSAIWRPNNLTEWQRLISELVKRYSIDKKIVSYWEIGNETDFGETGGCPYLITDPQDYYDYYVFTQEAILEAWPEAKVGGPAAGDFNHPLLEGFIQLCMANRTRLDFVSWHIYSDHPKDHALRVRQAKEWLAPFGEVRPEMLITEWNKSFESLPLEEMELSPRKAAFTAAALLAYMEEGGDWTFYYHVWDQLFYPSQFKSFYKDLPIMIEHWNEAPHRFGLFGVSGEIRAPYFVYLMMSRMGDLRVETVAEQRDLRAVTVRRPGVITIMLVNYNPNEAADCIAVTHLQGLSEGAKRLEVFRLDESRTWDEKSLELLPVESRLIDTIDGYAFKLNLWCPGDSVCWAVLTDL